MDMGHSQVNDTGLISAFVLNGEGGGRSLDWSGIRDWKSSDGVLLLYFDYSKPDVQHWLQHHSDLDDVVQSALMEEETRPRSMFIANRLLANLRVVNFNPGADPEDMVSLRMWFEKDRVIFTRHRRVISADELCAAIERGVGPNDVPEILIDITDRMVDRIAQIIEDIDDQIDILEEKLVTGKKHEVLTDLPSVRRQAISLRRYLVPQREALSKIAIEKLSWLHEDGRNSMREIADRMVRLVEDVEEARDHATVIQDELDSYQTKELNKRIYFLTVVAAIFLPLTFFTGLLGINVGGIPGAEDPGAFNWVVGVLGVFCLVVLVMLKRYKWF